MKCWILRRAENRSTRRKTSRSRGETQQTQPTYGVESGNRSLVHCGRQVRQPCSPRAKDLIVKLLIFAAHLAASEGHLPCLKFIVCGGVSIDHTLNARNDQVNNLITK